MPNVHSENKFHVIKNIKNDSIFFTFQRSVLRWASTNLCYHDDIGCVCSVFHESIFILDCVSGLTTIYLYVKNSIYKLCKCISRCSFHLCRSFSHPKRVAYGWNLWARCYSKKKHILISKAANRYTSIFSHMRGTNWMNVLLGILFMTVFRTSSTTMGIKNKECRSMWALCVFFSLVHNGDNLHNLSTWHRYVHWFELCEIVLIINLSGHIPYSLPQHNMFAYCMTQKWVPWRWLLVFCLCCSSDVSNSIGLNQFSLLTTSKLLASSCLHLQASKCYCS